MGMTFSYISFPLPERSRLFGGKILRPIIPIEITIGAITVGYAALIDSGADFCIFDGELGELFGLDVRSGDRLQFNGIQEA
ncbi:MAG: hypothetical protein U1C18_00935, partial [Patescibacteria group bacterium]|nr:hypothetical protein [Patescibacteria group bacterium]